MFALRQRFTRFESSVNRACQMKGHFRQMRFGFNELNKQGCAYGSEYTWSIFF